MTICIAAVHDTSKDSLHKSGVVMAMDWQRTDSSSGVTSETAFKLQSLTTSIAALGSGDITKFEDLIWRTREYLGHSTDVTVKEVTDCYKKAEADWRHEYLERKVLVNFGTTWAEYYTRLEQDALPEAYIRQLRQAVELEGVPLPVDVIIAGLDFGTNIPRIFMSCNAPPFDDCSITGYATIGEGDAIAQTVFQDAYYSRYWSKADTAFLCLMAKKRAEAVSSVGRSTALYGINKDGIYLVSKVCQFKLEGEYTNMNSKQTAIQAESYEKIKQIIEEFPLEQEPFFGKKESPLD